MSTSQVIEKLASDTLVRLGLDRYKSRLLKSKNCPMESRLGKVKEASTQIPTNLINYL